jgi:citrate synthase
LINVRRVMWLSAMEALSRLGSKTQTLYANVSRGRIRARPDPADSRRSLYNEDDVDRLAARTRGRRSAVLVAEDAINWGDPVLASAISTISDGRLFYRGQDAVALSDTATLEDVASLLWEGPWIASEHSPHTKGTASFATAFVTLAELAANTPARRSRNLLELRAEAGEVFTVLSDALLGPGTAALHVRLANLFGRPEAAEPLRRALVLLAEHELNASAFAARVTVSSGSSLAAGALAGLAALNGNAHGNAAAMVWALADDLGPHGVQTVEALREWIGEGRQVPGFGHKLYPQGDVRAEALLRTSPVPTIFKHLATSAMVLVDQRPNIDFALAAMASSYDLPRDAPIIIFALARSVGWLAHMLEQIRTGSLIRPRARYVGLPVKTT